MDVVGVKGCSDLVDVAVNEPLGPCHNSLGLRALFGSGRHVLDGVRVGRWGTGVEQTSLRIYLKSSPIFSRLMHALRHRDGRCHGGNGEWSCGENARNTDGKLIRSWHLDRHQPPSWYSHRSPIPSPKTDNVLSLSGKSECLDREGSLTSTTRLRRPQSGNLPRISPPNKSRSFLELNT